MILKFITIISITLSLLMGDEVLRQIVLDRGFKPIPKDFQSLVTQVDDSKNPMSTEKIFLGKKLFNDKNLSLDRSLSCATCHDLKKGGEDSKPTAIGYKKRPNPKHLNTLTVLNTAFSKHFFWDASADSLEEQAKGPIQAHFEMASTPKLVEQRVKENQEYRNLFKRVFADKSIVFENVVKAIAVYEKTLVTRSKFDDFLDGNLNALDVSQKRGLKLFINLGCMGCHYGPALGGQKVQKFPLRDYNSLFNITTAFNEKTKRRKIQNITLNFKMHEAFPFENKGGFLGKNDERKFRVPILRNISKTAPYFHNGQVKTLKEAIKIMSKNQVGVSLSEEQVQAMESFLKSLDGELIQFNMEKN